MTIFAIYKYVFTQAEEGDLFVEGTMERLLDRAQEIFNGMISGDRPFPVQLPKRDGTSVALDNEVQGARGHAMGRWKASTTFRARWWARPTSGTPCRAASTSSAARKS